ncbi:unannotated protein [freshwater metagenome]|uniref:Unannotated protein n=1 Tax=freshwater metagenome TaxID=449393 RepID=A0A6J6QAX6_9ZZZZ
MVPGSGFGIQQWGWTMEEPIQVLGETPWITRSQVPLTPAATIRMLTSLESYLETGAGSPYLAGVLRRIGVDRILLRHDLDQGAAQSISSGLVSQALASSPGIERVETFGRLAFGPAIEVYDVVGGADGYRVRDADDVVTVASSVEDAVTAVGAGLVDEDQPMLVQGETGRAADIVGDGYRLRERAFGRVHDAESNVMAPGDPYHAGRVLPNYPGPDGSTPVSARYFGIAGVTATTANGYADVFGPVRPETAPWATLDGDPATYWLSAPFVPSLGQSIEIDLGQTHTLDDVALSEPLSVLGLDPVSSWRVSAGGASVVVTPDPVTRSAVADLGGVRADRLSVAVADGPAGGGQASLATIEIDGVTTSRSLAVGTRGTAPDLDLVFTAAAETRACSPTLLGPDCSLSRQRPSEESTGIDRTVTLDHAGRFEVSGDVVARSLPGTAQLLRPLGGIQVTGSSWLASDPGVSPRMAYDDDGATSWVADPRDPAPTLTFDLGRTRRITRLAISPPAPVAVRPTRVELSTDDESRVIDLDTLLDGVARFAPLRTDELTLTFSRPGDDTGRPLGVGEVILGPGRLSVPIDGAEPTGAVCGLGPQLVVDGRTRPTRVEGPIGAVIGNGRLAVSLCDGDLSLAAGEHRIVLRSSEQFQPVSLELRGDDARTSGSSSRTLGVVSRTDTRSVLEVSPGPEAVLSAPQSFNRGWSASVDGRRLEPVEVDGWAQGWVLPADTSGQVVLSFEPQRAYVVTLVGGLALMGLVLLTAAVVGVRTRLAPNSSTSPGSSPSPSPSADPAPDPRGRRGPRSWSPLAATVVATTACAVLGGVVGGPFVALAAALGSVLAGRRVLAVALASLLMLAGLLVVVVQLLDAPVTPDATADLLTGAGLALAMAAAWRHRSPDTAGAP